MDDLENIGTSARFLVTIMLYTVYLLQEGRYTAEDLASVNLIFVKSMNFRVSA